MVKRDRAPHIVSYSILLLNIYQSQREPQVYEDAKSGQPRIAHAGKDSRTENQSMGLQASTN